MAKILVMVNTGKDNINTEIVAFNFSIKAATVAKATVEMLFLGRGVEAVNKNQQSSPQFKEQVDAALAAHIPLKACKVNLAIEGLTEAGIFPGIEPVLGAVETDARIEDGYTVITF